MKWFLIGLLLGSTVTLICGYAIMNFPPAYYENQSTFEFMELTTKETRALFAVFLGWIVSMSGIRMGSSAVPNQ